MTQLASGLVCGLAGTGSPTLEVVAEFVISTSLKPKRTRERFRGAGEWVVLTGSMRWWNEAKMMAQIQEKRSVESFSINSC